MIDRDSLEFTTALALGAALGAGLALLTRPEDSARRRVARKTRSGRRGVARESRALGSSLRRGVADAGRLGREARGLGADLRKVLKEEGADLLRESGREFLRGLLARAGGGSGRNGRG